MNARQSLRLFGACVAGLVAIGPAGAQAPLPLDPVDHIRVEKAARLMRLYANGEEIMVIRGIQLGDAPTGHKQFQGDERTPEGRYWIDWGNPDSAFHLSLHISYPNAADRSHAAARGRRPGGDIFIHGQPNDLADGRVPGDWTDGCIAVSNQEIELLWQTVGDGTTIEIVP